MKFQKLLIIITVFFLAIATTSAFQSEQVDATVTNSESIYCNEEGDCSLTQYTHDSNQKFFHWDGTVMEDKGGASLWSINSQMIGIENDFYAGLDINSDSLNENSDEGLTLYRVLNDSKEFIDITSGADIDSRNGHGDSDGRWLLIGGTAKFTGNDGGGGWLLDMDNLTNPTINKSFGDIHNKSDVYHKSFLSLGEVFAYRVTGNSNNADINRFQIPDGSSSTLSEPSGHNWSIPLIAMSGNQDGDFGFVAEGNQSDIFYFDGVTFSKVDDVSGDRVGIDVVDTENEIAIMVTRKGNIFRITSESATKIGDIADTLTYMDCIEDMDLCYVGDEDSVYKISDLSQAEEEDGELLSEDFKIVRTDNFFLEVSNARAIDRDESRHVYAVGYDKGDNRGVLFSAEYKTNTLQNVQVLDTYENEIPNEIDWGIDDDSGIQEMYVGTNSSIKMYFNASSPSAVKESSPVSVSLFNPIEDVDIFDVEKNLTILVGCGRTAFNTSDNNRLYSIEINKSPSPIQVSGNPNGNQCHATTQDKEDMVFVNTGKSGGDGFETYTYNYSTENLNILEEITVRDEDYTSNFQGIWFDEDNTDAYVLSNGKLDIYSEFGNPPTIMDFKFQCDALNDNPSIATNRMNEEGEQIAIQSNNGNLDICVIGKDGNAKGYDGSATNRYVDLSEHIFREDRMLGISEQGTLSIFALNLSESGKQKQEDEEQVGNPTDTDITKILGDLRTLAGFGGTTGATIIALIFIGGITFGGFRLTNNILGGLAGMFISTLLFYFLGWLPLIALILLIILGAFMTTKMLENIFFKPT